MTKAILVRHGETRYNEARRFQGRVDIPLNELGKKQAGFAREGLKDVDFDVIYSSPLSRAYETAEIIRSDRKLDINTHEGFLELGAGDWESMPIEEVKRDYPEEYRKWQIDPGNFKIPGSETFEEVGKRANAAFSEVIEANKGKTILIVSHMVCLSTIMLNTAGLPYSEIWKHPIGNASSNVIVVKDKPEIVEWNFQEYIPEEYRMKKMFASE